MIQKVAIGHRALTFSGLGVLNLWSQVVSDVALVLIVLVIDLVLDHEWHEFQTYFSRLENNF